jgi:AraC-like DNA-binding protein
MRFSFSTDDLEPAARFEAFRDHLARRLFQLDLVSRGDGPYRGLVDLDVTGSAIFGRVCGSAADFVRTRGLSRQCEKGVWLLFAREGRMGVGQGEVASILNPGDGFIFDAEQPHEGRCLGRLDSGQTDANQSAHNQSDTWVIQVRDEVIRPLRAHGEYPQLLNNAASSYAPLLVAMLEAHFHHADPADTRASEAFGRYLADIVALQLGANRDGDEEIAKRGLMAARRALVLEKIQARAADPAFNAHVVAAELGVTRRYIGLLLEETGRTFSEHVLDRRLAIAYQLLLTQADQSRTIASLALEAGFSDLSYFNRVFRRRFGDTPGRFRKGG